MSRDYALEYRRRRASLRRRVETPEQAERRRVRDRERRAEAGHVMVVRDDELVCGTCGRAVALADLWGSSVADLVQVQAAHRRGVGLCGPTENQSPMVGHRHNEAPVTACDGPGLLDTGGISSHA